jgi:Family of unknown function (DUF5995)
MRNAPSAHLPQTNKHKVMAEFPVFVPASTIDEVLARLEQIIHAAQSKKQRIGYFAALYHKVTFKVKEGIRDGIFENGSRLGQLDVVFANRFLEAWHYGQHNPASPALSKSWRITFENCGKSSRLVLQHLLLGMNAHINYDLGISVAEMVAKGGDINDLRKDYNAINVILSSLTYGIFNKLNIISPFLSVLGFTGTKSNSMLVQFSLGNARDGSWGFATDLIDQPADQSAAFVARRDAEIEGLGNLIVESKGILRVVVFMIRLFEWKGVGRIIATLHTNKRLFMHELDTTK